MSKTSSQKKPPQKTKDEQRHYNMSRIKSKDTSIEVALRKALWQAGIRFRKNYKMAPGSPDIALTKHKIAIFCDGEFWHGKDWETQKQRLHGNREYWISKIEGNMTRDQKTDGLLRAQGWISLHFWGEDIKKDLPSCVEAVKETIRQVRLGVYDIYQMGERAESVPPRTLRQAVAEAFCDAYDSE
jgi:DNA mismatch endonuclease (patch repair protein)